MDRTIVWPGAIPLEVDLLNTNKYSMLGLSKLAAAILGTGTLLNGLACVADSPASLNVSVAPGEIYSLQNVDGTAYSSLAADTAHQILKQGIRMDAGLLSCPAPGTAGQSINYLIQVTYTDTDSGSTVLPYYNASNPAQAYSGPNNSGTAQNTVRKGVCTVAVKAGVAAATGSQTTPTPDAGYVGAWVVTVANGQTTITAGDISQYVGAPFLSSSGFVAGGFQGNAFSTSAAGGAADALTGSFTPGISALTNGMTLYVRAASANATTTPTFTPNSGVIAAKTIVKGAGAALAAGDIAGGGHWIELQYDLTLDKWVLQNPATGTYGLATSAEAQALTDALKALTPATLAAALQGANQSIGTTNGYQKLPGGLILQWGQAGTNGTGDTAITFPIAFPNGVRAITIGTIGSGAGYMGVFNTQTLTGFNVGTWSATATRAGSTVHWAAIGN